MRMSSAWTKIVLENTTLKMALLCVTLIALSLSALLFLISSKDPFVIERACYSRALMSSGAQQTKDEVEVFARLAVSQRFDTESKSAELLDPDLRELRNKEQIELSSRQMKQFVHVNAFSGEQGAYSIDADRVVSVGNIRSALRLPLTLKIAATERTAGNPYGLVLIDAVQVKESKDEK